MKFGKVVRKGQDTLAMDKQLLCPSLSGLLVWIWFCEATSNFLSVRTQTALKVFL